MISIEKRDRDANLAMPIYCSRRSGFWTYNVTRRSEVLTLFPNIRTKAVTSYASLRCTRPVISCWIPFQLCVRSVAAAKNFPDFGRTFPSPMESCNAILQPLPVQLFRPSSNWGFSMMFSSSAETHTAFIAFWNKRKMHQKLTSNTA